MTSALKNYGSLSNPGAHTHKRKCPICEAGCGLLVAADHRSQQLTGVRGDPDDISSKGFLCVKGYAWKDLHNDPDLIKTPLIRKNGVLTEASWEEAFDYVGQKLNSIRDEFGPDSIGFYIGNPIAHKPALLYYTPPLLEALESKNVFSASSVDTTPKFLSSVLMFGDCSSVPVPDVDRTDFLVIHGANPVVSNGSLLTAPGVAKRIKAIRARGGKVVVIDPRRTETAAIADEHLSIKPGMDAYFLLAVLHTIFEMKLVRLRHLQGKVRGLARVKELCVPFSPELVADICNIPTAIIRQTAKAFAQADSGAWYGRFGTCTQSYGTLSSWLQDVINVVTGNIDREGGMLFPAGSIPPFAFNDTFEGDVPPVNRWQSRVSNLPEFCGTLPNGAIAEEILTPGEGQIRAFITMAGNPVLSNPNSQRLTEAFSSLDFMVSIDIYLNETTRHADVILPSPPHAMHSDFPSFYVYLSLRNVPKWNPPIFPLNKSQRQDWQILSEIGARLTGICAEEYESEYIVRLIEKMMVDGLHPLAESIDPHQALKELGIIPGPDRVYDLLLRTGRNGDCFGLGSDGLSLAKLKDNPNGIDFGLMKPRLDEALKTPDKMIDLAPAYITHDLARLKTEMLVDQDSDNFLLIGRRIPRSNNSWTHNLPVLVKGKDDCTALLNPIDARGLKISNGDLVTVASSTGNIQIVVALDESVPSGVVSIPHGWGHNMDGTRLDVAMRKPGANYNQLVDDRLMDVPSGNAVFNGIPVTITAALS